VPLLNPPSEKCSNETWKNLEPYLYIYINIYITLDEKHKLALQNCESTCKFVRRIRKLIIAMSSRCSKGALRNSDDCTEKRVSDLFLIFTDCLRRNIHVMCQFYVYFSILKIFWSISPSGRSNVLTRTSHFWQITPHLGYKYHFKPH